VGVVHLPALPGAPTDGPELPELLERAVADARTLAAGGADGIIVENFGDAPFARDAVPPVTTAAMTRVALAIREATDLPLGINVLRNDGLAALAVASVVGAAFVRINVLSGTMVTDQGVIEGRARDIAMARRHWGRDIRIAADVLVKHAAPLGPAELTTVARDTFHRAGADALIVTGSGTGQPTSAADLQRVREAVPTAPTWLGSGLSPANAPEVRDHLDVAIVGTWLHRDAHYTAPLELDRVRAMRDALMPPR
jgi:membrane complex biogenesis BtpA family protein